jgi:hypothetical protein
MDAVDDEPTPVVPGDVEGHGEVRLRRSRVLSLVPLRLVEDVPRPQTERVPVAPPERNVEDPLELADRHQLDRAVATVDLLARDIDEPRPDLGGRARISDRPGVVHRRRIPTLSDGVRCRYAVPRTNHARAVRLKGLSPAGSRRR